MQVISVNKILWMKTGIIRKILVILIILVPLMTDLGCKKQPKCGCGKDVIFELDQEAVYISFNEDTHTVIFYPAISTGATYYFCNPGEWIDTLKMLDTNDYLLVSGKVYYECNYLYNSGNYYYQIPPVYQVDVSAVEVDNYGK